MEIEFHLKSIQEIVNNAFQVVFISGPYRADTPRQIQRNINKAAEVALKYWKMGYAVICPHTYCIIYGECVDSVWLEGDLEMLRRCDGIVMMEGWENSKGSEMEHAFANEFGIKVIYEKSETTNNNLRYANTTKKG